MKYSGECKHFGAENKTKDGQESELAVISRRFYENGQTERNNITSKENKLVSGKHYENG